MSRHPIRFPLAALALLGAVSAQIQSPSQRGIPADGSRPVTTASGLVYSVLKPGKDDAPQPKFGEQVRLHFSGWLSDGRMFETSEYNSEPRSMILGLQMPRAWTEALQLMRPGQRLKITCPPALAFGKQGLASPNKNRPAVPPDATVVYELVYYGAEPGLPLKRLPAARLKAQVELAPGLRYELLDPGQGESLQLQQGFELAFHQFNSQGDLLLTSLQDKVPSIRGRYGLGKAPLAFLAKLAPVFKLGQRLRVEVPAALCFGDRDLGFQLPAGSTTCWLLEVERILPVPDPRPVPAFRRLSLLKSKRLASGVRYEVLQPGTGEPAKPGQRLRYHLVGWLGAGEVFEETHSSGIPSEQRAASLVPGLAEAMLRMRPGAVWLIDVPPARAYGLRGNPAQKIGPNRRLYYRAELIKVLDAPR